MMVRKHMTVSGVKRIADGEGRDEAKLRESCGGGFGKVWRCVDGAVQVEWREWGLWVR